ncbi:MAG TPA: LuxR C-terminal-related transcriptional regulator [Candidatus Limnocylindrales bacterium]|nr:LuxR C-terminal-related transcriptional regulator [Candidatus Limnocylindrales bacterium]
MAERGSISPREEEVLRLLGEHLTNAEIADRLVISIRTVESHVAALMRKLDAPNRRALARAAEARVSSSSLRTLPASVSSFVGREAAMQSIRAALAAGRLVTVTGPGGVGKTRVAVEAVRALGEDERIPIWFVDLAPLGTEEAVLDAIAATIDARSEPGRPALDTVADELRRVGGVVLLDNCEHLIHPVAGLVGALLRRVHGLRLLLTSREALTLAGERVIGIDSLETPPRGADPATAMETEAVRLFVDRASAVRPAFDLEADRDSVVSVVRRLDGIPLAIELAAAQAIALEPRQIDERLRDRFTLLSAGARDADPRHGTLRAALDWSYQLLEPDERALLDRLSVFSGSFSLDAAEALHALDGATGVALTLTALVRKSLVSPTAPAGPGLAQRFRLLELVREFALGHLEASGEADAWRDRHLEWVLGLAGRAIDGFHGAEQPRWLDVLDNELDNIEEALAWAVTDVERAGRALAPVALLQPYWLARGTRRARGVRWARAISEAATSRTAAERTRGIVAAVSLVMWSDLDDADTLVATATAIAGTDGLAVAQARLGATFVASLRGERVVDWTDEGVAAGLSIRLLAWLRFFVALAAKPDAARTHDTLLEIAADLDALGDEHLAGSVHATTADFSAAAGLPDALEEAAKGVRIAGQYGCASCLSGAYASMSIVDPAMPPRDRAALARDAVAYADDIGEVWNVLMAVEVLGAARIDGGELEEGLLLIQAAASARRASGFPAILPGRTAAAAWSAAVARARLAPENLARITERGRALEYRDMVAFARS